MADINNLPQLLTIDQVAERLASPSATSGGPGADMTAAPEPPRLFDDPVAGESHIETPRPGPIQDALQSSPGLAVQSPIVERISVSKKRSQPDVGRLVARGDAAPYRKERPMPRNQPLPHLLTIEQLADHLGVTVRHVRRQIAERRVPYIKVGRLVRFDPAEITRWIDGSRYPEGAPPSGWQ